MQQTIGNYRVVERIAAGGQATVYRAWDSRTGEVVALKVLHPHLTSDANYLERFRREAQLAAGISHPNVVRVFEVGQEGESHFIALEYLPISLHNLIEAQGEMPIERALDLARQIASGLEAAHQRGIVHRDIKPHNVLIGPDGSAKLTDFGISRAADMSAMTKTGSVMGSPTYMSPEQAQGTTADIRSDIYSYGVMLYQMLAGEVPFEAETPQELMRKQMSEQARPLGQLRPDVPASLERIVARCMEKDPDRRFATPSELEAAINQAFPSPARPALPEPVEPPSRPRELVRSTTAPPARPLVRPSDASSYSRTPTPGRKRGRGWALGLITMAIGMLVGAVWLGVFDEVLSGPPVVVAHWTTGHLTRDGLLKEMAEEFNKSGNRIGSGQKVVVEVYDAPSELIGKYLSERLIFGTRRDLHAETSGYVVENIPDPTIVTPSSAHWLVTTNYEVGRDVVDLDAAASIVRPVIGIVTYEEMARCLGWPQKEIGFADIIALRNDPQGWASYSCAKLEWGQRPLLAFTDPTTSSTGRSLHLALYSFAANKSPEDLTVGDVNDPEVVANVKEFQSLIDHYLIGTTVLNTKIYQGPRYGHFFIMPEDNLIHLYEGTEKSYLNGIKTTAPPIDKRMVMIYPKEGAMPRNNCACIVQADWVSQEQVEASRLWIEFIREDEQQRAFMAAGFRPGTDLDLRYAGSKISAEFGLNPDEPRVVLNPSLTRPEVAAAIDANWEQVKRPGIVTFVMDTSGSMQGDKLQQAKDGLILALDAMAKNNQVGFLTFASRVSVHTPVASLAENRDAIAESVRSVRARNNTALYDAIRTGIEMTDAAEGAPDAIRAIVVLTDGRANHGETKLHDLIRMMSRDEALIRSFDGTFDSSAVREDGRLVRKEEVIGLGLALETEHPVQIFFIGIGDNADIEIGRMLAEATGAEFQGVADEDLASVLEEYSKYF